MSFSFVIVGVLSFTYCCFFKYTLTWQGNKTLQLYDKSPTKLDSSYTILCKCGNMTKRGKKLYPSAGDMAFTK